MIKIRKIQQNKKTHTQGNEIAITIHLAHVLVRVTCLTHQHVHTSIKEAIQMQPVCLLPVPTALLPTALLPTTHH